MLYSYELRLREGRKIDLSGNLPLRSLGFDHMIVARPVVWCHICARRDFSFRGLCLLEGKLVAAVALLCLQISVASAFSQHVGVKSGNAGTITPYLVVCLNEPPFPCLQ